MRFLLDQDVYATTARLLSDLGHDVIPVAQIGLAQADDEDLLRAAREQDRLFVTGIAILVASFSSTPWVLESCTFASCRRLKTPCTMNWSVF